MPGFQRKIALVLAVPLIAGCDPAQQAAMTPLEVYQPVSFNLGHTPTGYSERKIGEDRYVVSAEGHASSPPERLEKIALARAGEIGVKEGKPFFSVAKGDRIVDCRAIMPDRRGPARSAKGYSRVVEIEVRYLTQRSAPSDMESAETFKQMTAALAGSEPTVDERLNASGRSSTECQKGLIAKIPPRAG